MSEVSYAIQNLNQTINQFEGNVDVHIHSISNASANVDSVTKDILTQVQQFKQKMEHGEEKQLAHENIIRIDQLIKERFGDYETIRRTVIGVVRDFDINLVRNTTIQELSEELWVTSSRYWLSYALIAITAWVNDYPDVAKSALAESGRKDAIKTTLFFCLLNLRFDRPDVAKMWFREYLKTLDPTILQRETEVMLHAFLDGVFGKDRELEQSVLDVIDSWIAIISEDAQIGEELVQAYEAYLRDINPHVSFDYGFLLNFCQNVQELENSYYEVSKYNALLDLLQELNVDEAERTDENYKERLDAVLINLMSNYDAEEQELRNEQEYFNLVVENDGDKKIAEAQFENEMALQKESFNIGKQMINWAIYDETANPRVRKFAFQNTKSWFKTALDRFAVNLQQSFPIEYHIAIDTWTGVSNGNDNAELMENMHRYYETNKFKNMYVNTPNIAAVLIFIVSLALAFIALPVSLYALIATVGAGAFLIYRVLKAMKEYPARVNASMHNLHNTLTEISYFRQYFENLSSLKEQVMSETEFL
ncbi:MAG: hypothetical protein Q4B22_09490 [Eubacteriales bacterium]|nr:hypothetical protein [Eubacteriales bacterium]